MKKLLVLCFALLCLCSLTACRRLHPAPEKPVIYLYPTEETDVTVTLDFDGTLTAAYPAYNGGWRVTASPDGTLRDAAGREYYCLFWEGEGGEEYDFSRGFCVAGRDTAAFLEDSLSQLGLTDKEANEFIIYWLPRMEGNAYNLIAPERRGFTAVEWGGAEVS